MALAVLPLLAHSDPLGVPKVTDWSIEASSAQKAHKPIMIVFGSDNCRYCDDLTEQVLQPLMNSGDLSHRVHLREYKINRAGKVVDFDGLNVRSRVFVSRYQIFATPTVLFLDPKGEIIGEPIVGFNNAEEYRTLLNNAINKATDSAFYRTPKITSHVQ
ncbi:MAG: thioredoxin fold domain-containing protein [Sedimenticola sp.]|nr:thioredoxin fold domain-containing protein [Sedimenticola sp.]